MAAADASDGLEPPPLPPVDAAIASLAARLFTWPCANCTHDNVLPLTPPLLAYAEAWVARWRLAAGVGGSHAASLPTSPSAPSAGWGPPPPPSLASPLAPLLAPAPLLSARLGFTSASASPSPSASPLPLASVSGSPLPPPAPASALQGAAGAETAPPPPLAPIPAPPALPPLAHWDSLTLAAPTPALSPPAGEEEGGGADTPAAPHSPSPDLPPFPPTPPLGSLACSACGARGSVPGAMPLGGLLQLTAPDVAPALLAALGEVVPAPCATPACAPAGRAAPTPPSPDAPPSFLASFVTPPPGGGVHVPDVLFPPAPPTGRVAPFPSPPPPAPPAAWGGGKALASLAALSVPPPPAIPGLPPATAPPASEAEVSAVLAARGSWALHPLQATLASGRAGFARLVALGYDPRMLLHDEAAPRLPPPAPAPAPHPERSDRLRAVVAHLAAAGLFQRCWHTPARCASGDELGTVHSRVHLDRVAATAGGPPGKWGGDTYFNAASAGAAALAAGTVLEVTRQVVLGHASAGLALVRPPGHHAEPDAGMGFCLYNNVAVAAAVARRDWGVRRVLILDWDVHHGNGTAAAFAEDPSVLVVSLHRHDGGAFYPGTGAVDAVGVGAGAGTTVNIPWPRGGMGDGEYMAAFDAVVMPLGRAFDPDLVIVSAGFDAAAGDPLGGCTLTPAGYAHMTAALSSLAGGRLVVALEGGYNLAAIAACTAAVAGVLLGDAPPRLAAARDAWGAAPAPRSAAAASPADAAAAAIVDVLRVQRAHWPCLRPARRAQFRAAAAVLDGRRRPPSPVPSVSRFSVGSWAELEEGPPPPSPLAALGSAGLTLEAPAKRPRP